MNCKVLTISLFLATISWYIVPQKIYWHFSPELLANTTHHVANSSSQPIPHTTTPDREPQDAFISYDNAQRIINGIAVIYAAVKIYEQYQLMGKPCLIPTVNQSWTAWVKNYAVSLCPDGIRIYGSFLFDSSIIVCQTLVYKTVARLLVLCAYGDISDLISSVIRKGTNLCKKIVA